MSAARHPKRAAIETWRADREQRREQRRTLSRMMDRMGRGLDAYARGAFLRMGLAEAPLPPSETGFPPHPPQIGTPDAPAR